MLMLSIEIIGAIETAAAVVQDGRRVLSISSASQVCHPCGNMAGWCPRLPRASTLKLISFIIEEALREASVTLSDIEGSPSTKARELRRSPCGDLGLPRRLLTREIAPYRHSHIEGIFFAAFSNSRWNFRFVALVVSGGHTHLFRINGFGRYQILGQTLDDAAGEAFDKLQRSSAFHTPGARQSIVSLRAVPAEHQFPRLCS